MALVRERTIPTERRHIYIYMESLFLMFLDHTRRTTVGRTPLDEWSARSRDLYLTTHDTPTAEILGSITTGGMDICLLWVSCVVRWRSLRWADHSSRGVLPTVVRRCVWSRNIKNRRSIYIYDISSLRVNPATDNLAILIFWQLKKTFPRPEVLLSITHYTYWFCEFVCSLDLLSPSLYYNGFQRSKDK